MRNIKLILAFLLIQGVTLRVGGVEIEVGNRLIDLPLPDGFVELTPNMPPHYESMRLFVAPSNLLYLTLIPANNAEALLRGEFVNFDRYINVESNKGVSNDSVSSTQFAQLRSERNQMVDTYNDLIDDQWPGIIDHANATLSEDFDVSIAMELGGFVPLPVHLDTDIAIAHSIFATANGAVDGESVSIVVVATILTLHVKDKVLHLHVNGREADLDWTRETAASWAADIVAANTSTNFNIEKGIQVALVGGVIALFVVFLNRRRRKE